MYAQMLVGMVALTGQWWLDVRKPRREEVAAHLVNLAWNGLTGLNPQPASPPTGRALPVVAAPRASEKELRELEKARDKELKEAGEGPPAGAQAEAEKARVREPKERERLLKEAEKAREREEKLPPAAEARLVERATRLEQADQAGISRCRLVHVPFNQMGHFLICPRNRSHPESDLPLPQERFLNREESWLQFNERVLELAEDSSLPLLERVRFLAIFASNLDEFFRVRVAGLKRRMATGLLLRTKSGLKPREELARIAAIAHDAGPAARDLLPGAGPPAAGHRGHRDRAMGRPGPRGAQRAAQAVPGADPAGADPAGRRPCAPVSLYFGLVAESGRPRPQSRRPVTPCSRGSRCRRSCRGSSRRPRPGSSRWRM